MIVKATVSFCGLISMGAGEVRDIPEGNTLADLLRAGYVEAVEAPKEAEKHESKRANSKRNK